MQRKRALADELTLLKLKNAELELQLQRQAPAKALTDAITDSSRPADASAGSSSLKPRGGGQHFKIRSWDAERMGRGRGISPDDSTTAIVPFKAIEDVALRPPELLRPALGSAVRHWIVQPKLIMAGIGFGSGFHSSVHDQFRSMGSELAVASTDVVTSRVTEVYAKHLQDLDRPHLAFSAGIPTLFNILQEVELSAGVPASASSGSQTGPGDAFVRCAAILRRLMDSSRFSKSPPRRRPDNITRPAYVRELCASVGLCLDLVRLGFVHKKQLKRDLALDDPSSPKQAFVEEGELCVQREELRDYLALAGKFLTALQMDMDRLHDEASDQARRAKAQNPLGDALTWFPMPEAEDEDAEIEEIVESPAKAREHGVEEVKESPPPSSPLSPATVATRTECDRLMACARGIARPLRSFSQENPQEEALVSHVEEPGKEHVEEPAKGLVEAPGNELAENCSKKERVLALVPSATPSSPSATPDDSGPGTGDCQSRSSSLGAARAASPAPSGDASSVDPLLTPTFGDFLEQQLLPLYIADVPFETLKHLSETCCGIGLNSDDERKAWKTLGWQMPVRSAPKKPARSRQPSPSVASVASSNWWPASPLSASPAPRLASSLNPSLAELCVAMEKPTKGNMGPPSMRQAMNTSVVEKRRKEFRAPADMETSIFRLSKKRTVEWPESPIIKPSTALLATPREFASASKLPSTCAPSPVSMRKTSRGRMELQSSAQSTTSQRRLQARGRSRSPCTMAHTPSVRLKPSVSQPDWHLLDTPGR